MLRLLASLSCLLPLSLVALRGAPLDPAKAPPLRLTVTIDGVEHRVVDGVAKQIELGGRQVALQVDVAPLRHFAAAGVEFDYPRDMAFEFEDSGGMRTWTLDGSALKVLIFAMSVGVADDMVAGILGGMAEVGKAKESEPCTVRYGGAEHPAKRVSLGIGSSKFEDVAFGVDRDDGGCVVILLQNSLGADGERSAEGQRMLELFEHTLVMAPR